MADEVMAAIQTAVDALPGSDASQTETPTVETPAVEAPVSESTPAAAAAPDEETELRTIEQDLVAKNPTLQNGRLSVSRHQAVVTRIRNQMRTEVDAAKAAAARYESPDWQDRARAIELAERSPQEFLAYALAHPTFAPHVTKLLDAEITRRVSPAPPVVESPKVAIEELPKPDKLYDDGSLGYTPETLEKVIAIRAKQATAEATVQHQAELAKLRKELEPVLEGHKADQRLGEAMTRMSGVLKNARESWPEFTTHEADIRAELAKDARMTLDEAYRRVVIPKFRADATAQEAAIRKQIVDEMNKATPRKIPTATHAVETVAVDPNVVRDTEDVIRESIRSLRT